MAPSDGQISFSYGATEAAITMPDAGYSTKILLPFDFLALDNGTVESRDYGSQYDKRSCEFTCQLPIAEVGYIIDLLRVTGRGQQLTLTLPTGSGFFPFGPDKGDEGTFTVVLILKNTPPIQASPFRYFKASFEMHNVGAWPAYSLPVEVPEGLVTIGTVSQCRAPQQLFTPAQVYSVHVNFTENNTPKFVDRSTGADHASSKFTLQCNESKCAAIVNYLTGTARAGTFSITAPNYSYVFGTDHGSGDTYTVQGMSNQIVIKHVTYNEYELSLELRRVS